MPRPTSYPFLIRQGRVWHARLDIPVDVRPAFAGKKVFARTTKLSDPDAAFRLAQPWIDQWKAEIDAVRAAAGPLAAAEIARRSVLVRDDPVRAAFHRVTEAAGFVARERLGLREIEWQNALGAHALDPIAALRALGDARASAAVAAFAEVRTPLAAHIEGFEQDHRASLHRKTLYQYVLDIRKFAARRDACLETVTAGDVQAFIDARSKEADVRTIRRQVTALRTYWDWLAAKDTTLQGRHLFEGIRWPRAARRIVDPTSPDFVADDDDGPRFTPAQVCDLWEAAHASGNIDLRDTIVVAAFTGGRREGIMSLHVNTVHLDDPVPYVRLIEKTAAGDRRVPAHPDVLPILRRRAANPQADGYLFRGGHNKIDSRGGRLTNPMRALLNAQGFGKGYGFHAFRRTLVDFLQAASVTELHAAKIVGHGIRTLTYGLYAGRLPLDHAARIMVETVTYPRRPIF